MFDGLAGLYPKRCPGNLLVVNEHAQRDVGRLALGEIGHPSEQPQRQAHAGPLAGRRTAHDAHVGDFVSRGHVHYDQLGLLRQEVLDGLLAQLAPTAGLTIGHEIGERPGAIGAPLPEGLHEGGQKIRPRGAQLERIDAILDRGRVGAEAAENLLGPRGHAVEREPVVGR